MSEDPAEIDALEERHSAEIARAHEALAAAQDKAYWLDRWQLDLNALMRRRGASEARAALRALRAIYRRLYDAGHSTRRSIGALPRRVGGAARLAGEERADADSAAAGAPGASSGRLSARPVTDKLAGRIDRDDPQALLALQRADALVDALGRIGVTPAPGETWYGLGTGSDAVLAVLGDAYPGLDRKTDAGGPVSDVAFTFLPSRADGSALERLDELRGNVKPGGRLLLSAATSGNEERLTAELLLARCTPEWRVALYLPHGMEGPRDLYVLERA